MSDAEFADMRPLPVAPRYLKRNAQRAMSGYVVRGLVELITNARDSGYRLYAKGKLTETDLRSRPIELVFDKTGEEYSFIVRDRFEGMSAETMQDRLLQYGEAASEFESEALVRGINARGAKDVAILGRVRFDSLHDGQFVSCVIDAGRYSGPVARRAAEKDRIAVEIAEGNGTVVRLFPAPETTVPNFLQLARDLERHIEVRYSPEDYPRIPLSFRERKKSGPGHDRLIEGFQPAGEVLEETALHLPEFASYGESAILRLHRSPEELKVGGGSITRLWRSEAGILIVDGRAAHDIGFLGASYAGAASAQHLFGTLYLPQIPQLLIEFEQIERARENDSGVRHDELNPTQVTDPDRQGLNREHPFVKAVEEVARPRIEAALATLQEEITPSAQERISSELRKTLEKLGERLAEQLEVAEGAERSGRELAVGLSFIPSSLRVEIGQTKRAGVYLRVEEDEAGRENHVTCSLSAETDAFVLGSEEVVLERSEERQGVYYGSLSVEGGGLIESAFVRATAEGRSALLKVSVRDPIEQGIELDRDLQFSQRRYTSVPGRNKKITVYADPSFDGRTVSLDVSDTRVEIASEENTLTYDRELGVAVAQFTATSSDAATATVTASAGDYSDEAAIVVRELGGKARVDFEFLDNEDFGLGRRFRWHFEKSNVLQIAAKHPTLARVLGPDIHPKTGEEWPGQHAPQSRAILAELIAEAYVDRRLQSELPSLGIGAENLVDPVDYENFRYQCYDEVFATVHEALTPEYSW